MTVHPGETSSIYDCEHMKPFTEILTARMHTQTHAHPSILTNTVFCECLVTTVCESSVLLLLIHEKGTSPCKIYFTKTK